MLEYISLPTIFDLHKNHHLPPAFTLPLRYTDEDIDFAYDKVCTVKESNGIVRHEWENVTLLETVPSSHFHRGAEFPFFTTHRVPQYLVQRLFVSAILPRDPDEDPDKPHTRVSIEILSRPDPGTLAHTHGNNSKGYLKAELKRYFEKYGHRYNYKTKKDAATFLRGRLGMSSPGM